jgi:hypothetical protein
MSPVVLPCSKMRGMLIAAACAVKLDGSQIGLETGVLLQAALSKQLFCVQIM